VPRERAREVRQRIGRVGDRDEHGIGRDRDDARDDVSVHRRVRLEQLQPPALGAPYRRSVAAARPHRTSSRRLKRAALRCRFAGRMRA
jgi:hypothetical protein